MFPNVFTGQPYVAPGIIQHHPEAPTKMNPEQVAAAVAAPQPTSAGDAQQPPDAYLAGPSDGVSFNGPAPFVLPGWAKVVAAILLIGGAGTVIYFGTRE